MRGDGRRRHRELVWGRALGAKAGALPHAKAVLLVHDDKGQVVKGQVIAENGRGAKQDGKRAGRKPRRRGSALRHRSRPCDESP